MRVSIASQLFHQFYAKYTMLVGHLSSPIPKTRSLLPVSCCVQWDLYKMTHDHATVRTLNVGLKVTITAISTHPETGVMAVVTCLPVTTCKLYYVRAKSDIPGVTIRHWLLLNVFCT